MHRAIWGLLCALACGLAGTGCATHFDRIQPVREAFYSGRLDVAAEQLDKKTDLRLRNDDVKRLDRAMIELAAGRPADAEKLLREVRDRFDHLEQKSLAEGAASMVTDDNIKAYPGEDYERVMVRAMLALTNLMTDGGDAGAYALQVTDEQQQIIEAATRRHEEDPQAVLAYKQVPLGPYIRAMLAEESPLTLDDAARARVQVASWAPDFPYAQEDIQRAKHEVPIPPGHGVLYLFALVGRGPVKHEVNEEATQLSLLIADRIISHNSNHGLPPTLAPVKVPKVRTYSRPGQAVAVQIDGQPAGKTAVLMDVGQMAKAQHDARYPYIVAQAVARRVIKKGAIYAAKDAMGSEKWSASSIALSAAGVAWEATESADTRCWALLPDNIQVLRLELPAGKHTLTLSGIRGTAATGSPVEREIIIREGYNTYAMGMFPDGRLVGELLVSGQD